MMEEWFMVRSELKAGVENLAVCDQIRPNSPIETLLMHAVMAGPVVCLDGLWAEMNGFWVGYE